MIKQMKVLYIWKNYQERGTDAFFLEIPKNAVTKEILSLLKTGKDEMYENPVEEIKSGRYYKETNKWAQQNPTLAKKDCIYVLVNRNAQWAKLCWVYYPYAGMWNGCSPFQNLDTGKIPISDLMKLKTIES
jgi:hypothetical protein